ncbi:LIM domain transcription factor LMO4.1-like isoform X1 [Acipenser oxyrinchus oxyrinchus]|uniref:LIM domain transcription factor LMO4.1-like isoform X1 n=1 Tax=Acipenser oxyrinchus oxyrinchus TaxID=40147 RepID=A0AAD8CU86_ACIOX|nr:LIM domain transcription factor LMO4.1-like isoform X1 [Acipenser oxyrinchus oxyrinchus]
MCANACVPGARDMVNNRSAESQAVAVAGGGSPPRSCAGCGGKIADRFLLYSMERYWHTRCLKCSCCQAQLGEIGTSCYSKGGMILCRNDYIRLFGHSGACSACGQSIPASEMVMRAQGNVYHLKCFTCATCRNRLVPGDRFHYVNGTIFCEHDRPSAALLNSHLPALQSSTMLPDQKVPRERESVLKSWRGLCLCAFLSPCQVSLSLSLFFFSCRSLIALSLDRNKLFLKFKKKIQTN